MLTIRQILFHVPALMGTLVLLLPPGGATVLGANPVGATSPSRLDVLRGEYASVKLSVPKDIEAFQSLDPRVMPHGDRISLKSLDLSRPPTEEELRRAGQLGSPLTPSRSADPTKAPSKQARLKQEADNLAFGQAMQKWNEHKYQKAEELFHRHMAEFPNSPWAGESALHLGCKAQFEGAWQDAKNYFELILANQTKGSDIWQKAKLRRAVLHLDQGELDQSSAEFVEMLKTETTWERRTYAQRWLHRISLLKHHELALRDCGADCIAKVLELKGEKALAAKAKEALAPDPRGFSLAELSAFAGKLTLRPVAVRGDVADLGKCSMPLVAHYSDRHFVVVQAIDGDGAIHLYDPRLKHDTTLSRVQFAKQWSGLAVLFDAAPEGARFASQIEMEESYGGCCGLPKPDPCNGAQDDCECQSGAGGAGSGGNGSGTGGGCGKGGCSRGLPSWEINAVNLNLVVQDTPLWYDAAVGPAINMRIVYNSEDSLNAYRPFGNKWAFDYGSYVMESPSASDPQGAIVILMPGGRMDTYVPNGMGGYDPTNGGHSILNKPDPVNHPYDFVLEQPNGTKFTYGVPSGMAGTTSLLLSIQDSSGNAVTIQHDSSGQLTKVIDALGHEFNFEYNAQGYVSRITDPWSRQCTFTYTANNLTGQTDMGGISYGYTYEPTANRMSTLTVPSGETSFYFEPPDQVVNSSEGYLDYSYPPAGGKMWENSRITVTHPDGLKEELYYNGAHGYFWHRDRKQYQTAGCTADALSSPKTEYRYTLVGKRPVVTTTTFADGSYTERSNFTSDGHPQSVRDENGHYRYFTYNDKGQVLTVTDARNHTTTYEYETNGVDLKKVTNHLNKVVRQMTYDPQRRVTSVTDALGRKTEYTYTTDGQVQSIAHKDAQGSVVQAQTMQYNASKQLEAVKQNGATLQSYVYDSIGRIQIETDRNGYSRWFTYDGLNRVERITFLDGSYTENEWGCCTVERTRDRMGRYTQYVHDRMKRVVYKLDPAGRGIEFGYDPLGNLVQLIDGNGNKTQWAYNARYQMVKKTYADGSHYDYTYAPGGSLSTRTDAKNVTTTYTYDDTNNLIGISAPGMNSISFGYDEVNRRTSMTDAIGTTAFGYDDAGQLTSVDGPWANDTVTHTYDALGRETVREINGSANSSSTGFDSMGRIESVTNPLGTFALTYTGSASSLLACVAYPNGQSANYTYYGSEGDLRLQTIWNKGTTSGTGATLSKFDYQYDAEGNITKWTQEGYTASPAALDLAYDPANELLGAIRKQVSDGTVLQSFGYTYDKGGNRVSEQIDGTLTTDSHNNLNQITSRAGGSGVVPIRGATNEPVREVKIGGTNAVVTGGTTFVGKASVSTGTNVIAVEATDGAGNTRTSQYQVVVSGSGSAALTYDLNGNLLNDGAGKTYEWTPLDQLAAINQGSLRTEFTYDGLGRRVRILEKNNGAVTATRNFVWVGLEIADERDVNNVVLKRFYPQGVSVPGATSPSDKLFYSRDHLSSVRELTDSNRAVRARCDYDPYGRRTKVSGDLDADFGFTGHFTHLPSGLALAPYRAYDSGSGRWLNRDPLFGAELLGDGTNIHSYVGNQPSVWADRLGLQINMGDLGTPGSRGEAGTNCASYATDGGPGFDPTPNEMRKRGCSEVPVGPCNAKEKEVIIYIPKRGETETGRYHVIGQSCTGGGYQHQTGVGGTQFTGVENPDKAARAYFGALGQPTSFNKVRYCCPCK